MVDVSADILVRPLRPDEGPAYVSLTDRVTVETRFMMREADEPSPLATDPEGRVRALLASGNSTIMVAEETSRLVGFVACIGGSFARNRSVGYLIAGILQSHAGRGLGRRLMQAVEDWARGAGMHRLELTVQSDNERARALYRRMGFADEAAIRRSMRIDGRWVDEFAMAKLLLGPDARKVEPDVPPSGIVPDDIASIVVRPLAAGDGAAFAAYQAQLRTETPYLLRTAEEAHMDETAASAILDGAAAEGFPVVGAVVGGAAGGRIVGTASIHRGGFRRIRHRAELGMGVLRDYWGAGLGRRLMEAVEAQARQAGLSRIGLEVFACNHRARRLYERLGYETEGVLRAKLRLEDGYADLIAMAKLLDA